MYLSNLNIFGFKSFAQKTDFKFSGGLTAVVGPNGCGKTNVVDAIRWVLGEQKTSVLRSETMNNVIFNGTKNRKPLGLAEVALTLQNNKNILPTEFNEVVITRRLFKSGESEYLLNNTKCRLRDILDLFMDTGIGANSYSVIELKMVEAILSGKPEERRQLMEEAAGVTRYKQKRKEATRRLQSVQTDLIRIDDLQAEKAKLVNSLQRQAAKTKRYNKLLEEVKELELNLLSHEYHHFSDEIESLTDLLDALEITKSSKNSEINDLDINLKELKKKLDNLELQYKDFASQEEISNRQLADWNKEIAVDEEKITSQRSKKDRILAEIERAKLEINELNQSIIASQNSLESIENKKSLAQEEIANLKNQLAESSRAVSVAREAVNQKSQELFALKNEIRNLQLEIQRLDSNFHKLNLRIEDSIDKKESLTHDYDSISSKISEQEALREELSERLVISESELIASQEHQKVLQSEIERLNAELGKLNEKQSSGRTSLQFFSSLLVDENESVKFLSSSDKWSNSQEIIMLAELADVEDKYKIAVNSALGSAGSYFVVDSRNEALTAMELLRNSNKGKAAFIVKEMLPSLGFDAIMPDISGAIGWLSELINCDDPIKSAFRAILGTTLLVQDLASAWEAVNSNAVDSAVTLDGELVLATGIIKGGSVLQKEGIAVGKVEKIKKLKLEISALDKSINAQTKLIADTKQELSFIDIRSLNDQVRQAENELRQNDNQISQMKIKLESIESNLQIIDESTSGADAELEEINKNIESHKVEIEAKSSMLSSGEEELASLKEDLSKSEAENNKSNEHHRQAENELIKLEQEIKSAFREIQERQSRIIKDTQLIENGNIEIASCDELEISLEKSIAGIRELISDSSVKLEDIVFNKKTLSIEIDSLKEQITQYGDALSLMRKELDKVKEEIHIKDVKLSELTTKLQSLIDRAMEAYEVEINSLDVQLQEDFSIENTRQSVLALKEKLSALGNVNFMALEEFDKESAELEFFNKQIADLKASEDNLKETISEINQTAQNKFLETFEIVNQNFQMLFKTLFNEEGEASLHLQDGDPLESNVEIKAKPPGKRPHSIEMLSGGEKTLTAIALLFGIYLVKPSPFCILDEVDAPLDDANIDKYIKMIRKFSNNTQFLIVTHNKKTMEASDTLYGITMQEEGVSKVVSVKLNQESL